MSPASQPDIKGPLPSLTPSEADIPPHDNNDQDEDTIMDYMFDKFNISE